MTPPTPPAVDERVLIRVSFRSHPAPLPWALRAQCRSREQEANAMTLDSRFRRRLPLAAGLVLVPDGYVVTIILVVAAPTEIRVKLADGRELAGRVVGRDPRTDLALLKVDAHGLPTIPLGDSAALKVGEPVMAIGNPFGLEQTVTTGIVSATGRVIGEGPYDDFIQTDASINPGNSGGPLINARGQAVGINTAIVSRSGGSVGIGFAIPVNLAKPVVSQLASAGHVTRGWLGVGIQPLTADLAQSFRLSQTDGAPVTSVSDGSPAAKAGLKQGDVIVEDGSPAAAAGVQPGDVIAEVDHHPVKTADDVNRLIHRRAGDTPTLLLVHRHGGNLYIALPS